MSPIARGYPLIGMGSQELLIGPDFAAGIPTTDLTDQPLLGHAGGEAIVLVRDGAEVRALGATCTVAPRVLRSRDRPRARSRDRPGRLLRRRARE
jgi:hypothetical protein